MQLCTANWQYAFLINWLLLTLSENKNRNKVTEKLLLLSWLYLIIKRVENPLF
jgi:hypothetical protein